MKPSFVKLEIAFLPCLSVITWSSLRINEICEKIKDTLKNVETFVDEVKYLKEAIVDKIFTTIENTELIKLEDSPISASEFFELNFTFKNLVSIQLKENSMVAERTVIEIINKFLDLIDDPNLSEAKYHWLDSEKINKPVSSLTKLTKEFDSGIYTFLLNN